MASVGVFDSGVGGLSVLAEIRRIAADLSVVYLADQAWAPYGERRLREVRSRSVAIARYLIDRDCDPIVVACNSASAAALHHLREVFSDKRFVGMEPAVKPAASQSERGVIGVLATEATFQGELYASVVGRHANGTEVVEQACLGLAAAVERLGPDHPETIELLATYVDPLLAAGADTIVLGCTHYPFLMPAIRRLAGDTVSVIDPAPAVARQAIRLVGEEPRRAGKTTFLTTGDPAAFAVQVESLLGVAVAPERVEIARQCEIYVVKGDLTRQDVDAIVNAANDGLQHGGGVAAAISRAGGSLIQQESDDWVRRHGRLSPGTAATTGAGAMSARYVIHVAGPIFREGQDNEGLLRAAVTAALEAAVAADARSIAFPAISAGIYGYPMAEAAAVLGDEVVRWVDRHPGALDEVRLVGFNEEAADHLRTALGRARSGSSAG